MNKESNDFAARLGSATAGRLEFAQGAYNATVRAGAPADELYRARFEGTAPDVRAEDGAVTVDYPRSWDLSNWGRHSADIVLNGVTVPFREFCTARMWEAVALPSA